MAHGLATAVLTGDHAQKDLLRQKRTPLAGHALFAILATQALAMIGERQEAHRLYPTIREVMEDGGIVVPDLATGLTEMTAGLAAACGARWATAETHFETALAQAHEIPGSIRVSQ